jgi:hypothetical protein
MGVDVSAAATKALFEAEGFNAISSARCDAGVKFAVAERVAVGKLAGVALGSGDGGANSVGCGVRITPDSTDLVSDIVRLKSGSDCTVFVTRSMSFKDADPRLTPRTDSTRTTSSKIPTQLMPEGSRLSRHGPLFPIFAMRIRGYPSEVGQSRDVSQANLALLYSGETICPMACYI